MRATGATWPVYVSALSIILVLMLIGYTVRENRHRQAELAEQVVEREKVEAARERSINRFLRMEVCERLELRDEIQLAYLRAALSRVAGEDSELESVVGQAIRALEITQRGCTAEIPEIGD